MATVSQPLQQLCNIIKAIANNDQEKDSTRNMRDKSSTSSSLMGKEEATDLALGIAKLMRMNSSESYNNLHQPPTSSLIENQNFETDQNTKLIKNAIEQSSLDNNNQKLLKRSSLASSSYLSCVLCRKRCRTKARFVSHFSTHFENAAENSAIDQLLNLHNNNNIPTSDDSDRSDEDPNNLHSSTALSHNRLKRKRKTSSYLRFKHSRILKSSVNIKNVSTHTVTREIDRDSGCHSGRSECYSSSNIESDNCPGDSELSSTDGEAEEYNSGRKSRFRPQVILKNKLKIQSSSQDHVSHTVSLKDRLSLAEKQLDNNETEGLICLTCLKRFSNCQNLRRHLRLHIARDSITPDIEKQSNGDDCTDDDLTEGKYFCDWCPARFDNRSAARIHESTHKGQDTKCYICDKSYADRYSLRYHLRTHGIGRQIRCEYCNKSFSKPSRLESHVKSNHHNIRNYPCSVCEKAFKTNIHLENHFRQHSGEKPFNCAVCGDNFRHKASLVTHQRSHDGLRPYCCEVCGKTFREPSTLKAHNRVHTGDKPYKCLICGKTFTQRAGLNYHKQSHAGIKPYKCNFCKFTTAKSSSLSNHYKNIHQLNESQLPPITKTQVKDQDKLPGNNISKEELEGRKMDTLVPIYKFNPSKLSNENASTENLSKTCQSLQTYSIEETDRNYNQILTDNNSPCDVSRAKEQCSTTYHGSLKDNGCMYSQRELHSTVPLPSPPMQSGDAVFLRRQECDTSLPSFNHLKTPSRSCSSASSSPTPNSEFAAEVNSGYHIAGEMHHTQISAPIPSLSPTNSTTSSSNDCNSNSFNVIPTSYSNIKSQNSKDISKFTREVTPPLTPPTPIITQQHQHTHTSSMDEFMIENTNGCGYLPTSFNIAELTSQYDHYESGAGVTYQQSVSYTEDIHHPITTSLQYHRSLQQPHNDHHNQQQVYQHTNHQMMQQQEWFGQQQAQNFSSNNSNNLQNGGNTMITENYENTSSYPHFSCSGNNSNGNNRGQNNCSNNVPLAQVGNTNVNYQTTSYPNTVNDYNQQQHQQHNSHQNIQTQHPNLQHQHQLHLHSANSITPSQVSHAINVTLSTTSDCQQQNSYSQQHPRHQNQGRSGSNSYSINEESTSRASDNSSQNLTSVNHVNDSYCQNSFVAV